jgi:hypothetical protein
VRRHLRGDPHRLTATGGLAALSLDALSSVAYGPEAIVLVLVAAGTAAVRLTLPIAIAITVLLLVLVVSYRQVNPAQPTWPPARHNNSRTHRRYRRHASHSVGLSS